MDNSNDAKPMLVQFVDRLLEEKGTDGLDPEVVDQMRKDLLERVSERVDVAVLELLPIEKLPELNTLLDTGTDKEVSDFYMANIPNFPDELAKALFSFRSLYLS
jgi:flagellar motor switch protein FliG